MVSQTLGRLPVANAVAGRNHGVAMQAPVEQLTLSLMVARGDGPPIGCLLSTSGDAHSFSGWLDFVTVLDDIRTTPSPASAIAPKTGEDRP